VSGIISLPHTSKPAAYFIYFFIHTQTCTAKLDVPQRSAVAGLPFGFALQ